MLAPSSTKTARPGQARDREEREEPELEAPKVDAESLGRAIPDENTIKSACARLLRSIKGPKWPGSGTESAGSRYAKLRADGVGSASAKSI